MARLMQHLRISAASTAALLALCVSCAWAQGVAVEVASVEEYWEAAATPNVEHIIYTNHLDFSLTNPNRPSDELERFGRTVKTHRGNCTILPSAVGVRLPLKPNQCLVTLAGLTSFVYPDATAWFSNIYIRKTQADREVAGLGKAGSYPLFAALPNSTLYLEDVTFQGDDEVEDEGQVQTTVAGHGLDVAQGARVYASGCVFVGFQQVVGAGLVMQSSTVSLYNTTFLDCHAVGAAALPNPSGPEEPPLTLTGAGGGIYSFGPSQLRLELCTFSGNSAQDERTADVGVDTLASEPAAVYSDGLSRPLTGPIYNTTTYTLSLGDEGLPGGPFLTGQDEWLRSAQTEQRQAVARLAGDRSPAPPLAPAPSAEPPSQSGGQSYVGIAAGVGGVAAAVILAALAVLFLHRRSRRHHAAGAGQQQAPAEAARSDAFDKHPLNSNNDGADMVRSAAPAAYMEPPGPGGYGAYVPSGYDGNAPAAHAPSEESRDSSREPGHAGAAAPPAAPLWSTSGDTLTIVDNETLHVATPSLPSLHGATASDAAPDQTQALLDVLEQLAVSRVRFLDAYDLRGVVDCRVGGQGVVQFMRHVYSDEQYVVKFYCDQDSFRREAAMAARSDLRRMMPAVIRVEPNADGAIRVADYVFPPFIVLERGQALDEWAAPRRPDAALSIGVLMHITERLRDLHKQGVAHRDLKPGNIIWRPQQTEWTLIDYGCAASIGQPAPLAFTLSYAPPEVIAAFQAGERTIPAAPASDIWSLGVIAFELFTASARAFPPGTTQEAVCAQILGRAAAPWEPGHADFAARDAALRPVGLVRRLVLRCLSRNPEDRPTAGELYKSLAHMFTSATTTQLSAQSEGDVSAE